MAPYTIDLHDANEAVVDKRHGLFACDDDAIDHAGKIAYPHSIRVWQGERLVAHFPAVGTGLPPR